MLSSHKASAAAATLRAPLVNPERITVLNQRNASSNRVEAP